MCGANLSFPNVADCSNFHPLFYHQSMRQTSPLSLCALFRSAASDGRGRGESCNGNTRRPGLRRGISVGRKHPRPPRRRPHYETPHYCLHHGLTGSTNDGRRQSGIVSFSLPSLPSLSALPSLSRCQSLPFSIQPPYLVSLEIRPLISSSSGRISQTRSSTAIAVRTVGLPQRQLASVALFYVQRTSQLQTLVSDLETRPFQTSTCQCAQTVSVLPFRHAIIRPCDT